jgi:CO dehydrogenase/acetyl-CoA synthase delta subunit
MEVAVDIPKISYTGKIKEVTIGLGEKALTVGGEEIYPFHLFEGVMKHPPRIAMEIYDAPPEDWRRPGSLSGRGRPVARRRNAWRPTALR